MIEVGSEHGVLCPVLHRARGRAGGAVTRPHLHPGEWNSIVYPSPRNTGAFFGHCATSRRFVASSSMYHTRQAPCPVSPHLEVAAVEERLTEVEILRRNMAPVSLQTVSTEYLVWGRGRGSPRGEDPHQVIELDISRAGAVYAVKPAPAPSSLSLI